MSASFDFDGRPVEFRPGQTVGAALTAAGTRSWRTTRRRGRPAGLFCGIGVCFECLLTVDGVPDQRACLVPAEEARRVESQVGTPSREAPAVPPTRETR